MHFVTGGAYNGKAQWVRNFYKEELLWISIYKDDPIPSTKALKECSYIVIEGIEMLIKDWLKNDNGEQERQRWKQFYLEWLEWERMNDKRQVILLGADITKGIVPIDKSDRLWRDIVGWVYQDTVKEATRVDIIWYGINQQLK